MAEKAVYYLKELGLTDDDMNKIRTILIEK